MGLASTLPTPTVTKNAGSKKIFPIFSLTWPRFLQNKALIGGSIRCESDILTPESPVRQLLIRPGASVPTGDSGANLSDSPRIHPPLRALFCSNTDRARTH